MWEELCQLFLNVFLCITNIVKEDFWKANGVAVLIVLVVYVEGRTWMCAGRYEKKP